MLAVVLRRRAGGRRARRDRRRRDRRGRRLPAPGHDPAPVQGRRGRPRPARLDADRRRSLAADRDRQRAPAPGRLSPDRRRARRADRLLARRSPSAGTPFQRLAAGRPGFPTTLGRALNRFEAGLERNVVVEALNDHLLALRFLLEGGGPADLGLSMRVAALCAEPDGRAEVKAVVDRAIGLERELWSGEPAPGAGGDHPGRDRRGARGPGARDPQGRGRRPPRLRPARRPPTRSCSPTASRSATAPPSSAARPPSGT